ncbi:MAG: hypothetical protein GOU97_04795 [Nanoarchaeota archaeon]|nr:hypothetical protein [Nanoarchaeota archaeon]
MNRVIRRVQLIKQTLTQEECEIKKETLPDGSRAIIITDQKGNRFHQLETKTRVTGTLSQDIRKTIQKWKHR